MNTEEQNTSARNLGSLICRIACHKHDLTNGIIACPECVDELIAERDKARAELEKFRAERDEAREKLNVMRGWLASALRITDAQIAAANK